MNEWSNELFGNQMNRKFTDIFDKVATFKTAFAACPWAGCITTTNQESLYYLLYAKYGNSTIANTDENQFKYKLFALIYQYGPNWEKRLTIQSNLRGLTEAELRENSVVINNHVLHPGENLPAESEELTAIDDQNTSKYKKSKADAWLTLMELLEEDFTEEFLRRFSTLFLTVVEAEVPLWYMSND